MTISTPRMSAITPAKSRTGIEPALYNIDWKENTRPRSSSGACCCITVCAGIFTMSSAIPKINVTAPHIKEDPRSRQSQPRPEKVTERDEDQTGSGTQAAESDGAVLAQPPRETGREQPAKHQTKTRRR